MAFWLPLVAVNGTRAGSWSRQTSVPQRKIELWRVRHPLPTLIFNLDEPLLPLMSAHVPQRDHGAVSLRHLAFQPCMLGHFEVWIAIDQFLG